MTLLLIGIKCRYLSKVWTPRSVLDPFLVVYLCRFYMIIYFQFPEWLTDSCPKANEPCYLHVIHLEPVYAVPESSRKLYFYEMMKSGSEYGILTRKKLPRVSHCKRRRNL